MNPVEKILGTENWKYGIFITYSLKPEMEFITVEKYQKPGERSIEIENYEVPKSQVSDIVNQLKNKYGIKKVFRT